MFSIGCCLLHGHLIFHFQSLVISELNTWHISFWFNTKNMNLPNISTHNLITFLLPSVIEGPLPLKRLHTSVWSPYIFFQTFLISDQNPEYTFFHIKNLPITCSLHTFSLNLYYLQSLQALFCLVSFFLFLRLKILLLFASYTSYTSYDLKRYIPLQITKICETFCFAVET